MTFGDRALGLVLAGSWTGLGARGRKRLFNLRTGRTDEASDPPAPHHVWPLPARRLPPEYYQSISIALAQCQHLLSRIRMLCSRPANKIRKRTFLFQRYTPSRGPEVERLQKPLEGSPGWCPIKSRRRPTVLGMRGPPPPGSRSWGRALSNSSERASLLLASSTSTTRVGSCGVGGAIFWTSYVSR